VIENPLLPICAKNINLAECDIQKSLIERERFCKGYHIKALRSYSSCAREPEKDNGIDKELENHARNWAHPFVFIVSN
jgi:hypothetical protein